MGLAQEVRDFIAGYSAVSDITAKQEANRGASAKAAQDKEYKDALLAIRHEELDLRKQALSLKGSGGGGGSRPMSEAQRERLKLDRERFEWQKKQGDEKAMAKDAEAAISGVDDSYDAGPDTTNSIVDQPPVVSDDDLDYYATQATGGMVSKYAEGGKVEDSAIPDAFSDKYGSAAKTVTPPAEAMQPAPGGKPSAIPDAFAAKPAPAQPAQAEKPVDEKSVKVVIAKAGEAAAAAMDSFEREVRVKPSAIGEGSEKSSMDIATGQGGMNPQEYEQVLKAVDPNNTIPGYLKSGAALSAAYDYFIGKGQTDKAVKAAKGFLIANKQATQTLGTLALEAFKGGDAEAACRLINDACNRFPSADQIQVTPDDRAGVTYSVMQGGKVVEQGKLNMAQAWELTGQIANGSLYVKQMAQFAKAHKKATPDAAITESNDAYATLRQTNDALTAAMEPDSDKTPEEIKALKAKAEAAKAAHEKAMNAAVKAGAKRRDVLAENKAAYEMAIPDVPEEATQDQRNWWQRNAPTMLGGQPDPVTSQGNAPAQAVPTAPATTAPAPAAQPAAQPSTEDPLGIR